jgi:hypothetical protein
MQRDAFKKHARHRIPGIGLSWSKWLKLGASSPNTRPPPTFVNRTLWNQIEATEAPRVEGGDQSKKKAPADTRRAGLGPDRHRRDRADKDCLVIIGGAAAALD